MQPGVKERHSHPSPPDQHKCAPRQLLVISRGQAEANIQTGCVSRAKFPCLGHCCQFDSSWPAPHPKAFGDGPLGGIVCFPKDARLKSTWAPRGARRVHQSTPGHSFGVFRGGAKPVWLSKTTKSCSVCLILPGGSNHRSVDLDRSHRGSPSCLPVQETHHQSISYRRSPASVLPITIQTY